jgi:hypothetical protein
MDGQIQRSRVETHLSFTFTRNIVYWKVSPLLTRPCADPNVNFDHNLYWNASGEPVTFGGLTFAEWQKLGKDEGSIIADPMFVDPDKYDFHLRPGSPAEKIGFRPFDYSKAGVYGDPKWVALAKSGTYPPVEFAPEPPPAPPFSLSEDFETLPVGAPPPDARVHVENKGDSIGVTDEIAAGGKHSLKIVDAPGLKYDFNPHFYYTPKYKEGVARCRFDIRVEPGVVMYHEWRDDAKPYRVGPSIWIRKGKLQIAGKDVLDVPANQWVRIEVQAGLGARSSGTWDLTVTLPGKPAQKFTGLTCNKDWKTLQWLGFSSCATEKTVYYLDNIEITNAADATGRTP